MVRTALQALAAVLGGTNSLHTNSLDEALALPTAEAATLALRTQQIIAHESGVTNVVDPLGGSYFVERLTLDMEPRQGRTSTRSIAWAAWSRRSSRAIPQREIAEASYRFQQAVERRDKVIVGVNDFVQEDEPPIRSSTSTSRPPRSSCAARAAAQDARQRRGPRVARRAARHGARHRQHDVPLLDCVRAYATVGEMCDALREVWGEGAGDLATG